MLAGAGSVFYEHFGLPYNLGLLITMVAAYLLLLKGISSIMLVNTFVVPVMLLYTLSVVFITMQSPMAGNWLQLTSFEPPLKIFSYAFLYIAGNLALAQAVLVPVGSAVKDRSVLVMGGVIGGGGIGVMLLSGHFALSAHMPGIMQYEIPMGQTVMMLGKSIQLLVIFIIFAEIFTTLLSDVYGLTLQLQQHTGWNQAVLIGIVLMVSYLISQIGFSRLLSTLYPLFGMISLLWLALIVMNRTETKAP